MWPCHPLQALAEARGNLFPWVPVAFAAGIGGYFALPAEPGLAALAGLGTLALVALAHWLRGPEAWQPLAVVVLLACCGALWAAARAHHVAAPVLAWRYYGAIEGRIVGIDRSLSDQPRLTLDRVVLENLPPDRTPARVRVALHGDQQHLDPLPGMTIMLTGHLSPPEPPAEPGGFDFQRLAWFDRLGGVGYTRSPALVLAPAEPGGLRVFALRMRISAAVQALVPGDAGAFAAAILTGDRSGVSRKVLDDLRGSNLAHLLAISGLHMGLLTGFVFAMLRYGFALIPPLALRLNAKKLAAACALAAGGFYLALSGGNVATERAFVMVAVMLLAVLCDRRAISLRSVALAAMIILVLRPEALLGAGFQMSFAATVALVAVFSRLAGPMRRLPRGLAPVASLLLASAVAGAATAPVSAVHFGRMADYGLLANLLSVPLMGTLIIPAAVLAALLAPFGLAAVPLSAMELGTGWILGVAAWVAGLDGAVRAVPAPPDVVLPLLALGALWLALWPGRARWGGVGVMGAALLLWPMAERPALLIAPGGGLVGVMTPEGRALSKPRGDGFVARSWLERDGDLATPEAAHARWPGQITLAGWEVYHLTGRGAADRAAEACRPGRLVILSAAWPHGDGNCWMVDARVLERTGTLALSQGPEGLRMRSARAAAGQRLWSDGRYRPPAPPPDAAGPDVLHLAASSGSG
ncbi:ComEC/Rec2 family competence protein [Plastorhodobacter daqingensis]|uniref:ComEC/Rec2 family competence protein n=1 Tax=Plastorhodobacter daqingensis TaxID=1387281 RepID=A0ABW2UJR9_9RHOB